MTNANKFFLGRQSILDRDQNLAGFELLFRSGQKNSAQFQDDVTATSVVINHAFNELGLKTVLGKFRGYINVNNAMLMNDMVELLPREQVIIELLETIDINAEIVQRCKYLKAAGYMLALDDLNHYSAKIEPLRGIVDVIKVDIQQLDHAGLAEIMRPLKKWPVQLLAEKVDNRETANHCMDLGFDLFQGYYFAQPIIITGKRLSHSELELLRLIGMVMGDAETAEIEQVFKKNPGLSFNLLRLSNTAASGAHRRITSVNYAIMELGRRQLKRWLQMLLFAHNKDATFPDPLLQLAATRGKFMELLVRQMGGNSQELEDGAFMVGIMSLMDTLLSMPLTEILSPLNPPAAVREALLSRDGQLGKLLLLIEQLEKNAMDAASLLLAELAPLDVLRVNAAQVEALAWANSIGQEI